VPLIKNSAEHHTATAKAWAQEAKRPSTGMQILENKMHACAEGIDTEFKCKLEFLNAHAG